MTTFQETAIDTVYGYVKSRLDKTDTHVTFGKDEVYVVWSAKVLQNWKALLSTTLPDGMYYEVTFNGDKDEIYLDAYKKFENVKYDSYGVGDKSKVEDPHREVGIVDVVYENLDGLGKRIGTATMYADGDFDVQLSRHTHGLMSLIAPFPEGWTADYDLNTNRIVYKITEK